MPQKYKSILGYGLTFKPSDENGAYAHDEDLEQDFFGTVEDRYPLLSFEFAGDLWNGGESECYVFAKSSVIEHRSDYGDRKGWGKEITLPGAIPSEEIAELWKFITDLSFTEGNVTWHLITCVH